MKMPDARGYFGAYGGRYVPETLVTPLIEVEQAWQKYSTDHDFQTELAHLLKTFVGRPTPLTYAHQMTEALGGAKVYLKREDLTHTGAHKINNTLGQILLAKRMGKTRIIAETGAGQHGVATATAAALMGMKCVIYQGAVDMARQGPNVRRMKLLGAEVVGVESGSKTLKDAINEAMRDWASNIDNTFYIFGSVLGAHPYPMLVREFQKVIGEEVRQQILEAEKRLPDYLVACVGGGSNAMGLFYDFIPDQDVKMIGVEAGGHGVTSGKHAVRFCGGSPGVLHGSHTWILQNDDGQIQNTHSISAGLDYPGVGPEHAMLRDQGRAIYTSVTDTEAIEAFKFLCLKQGIIPALETSHAVAEVMKLAPKLSKDQIIVMNLSGRGDKDLEGDF